MIYHEVSKTRPTAPAKISKSTGLLHKSKCVPKFLKASGMVWLDFSQRNWWLLFFALTLSWTALAVWLRTVDLSPHWSSARCVACPHLLASPQRQNLDGDTDLILVRRTRGGLDFMDLPTTPKWGLRPVFANTVLLAGQGFLTLAH